MFTLKRFTVVIIILCATFVQAMAQNMQVEVKARILYGDEPEQLKVRWASGNSTCHQGVGGIAVDKDESIYIADMGGKVKKYSPSGKFIHETEGIIDSFHTFAVSDEGEVIVRSECGGDLIEKYNYDGIRIWSKKFREIVSNNQIKEAEKEFGIELGSLDGWITTGYDGSIVAGLQCWAIPPARETSLRPAIQMTGDGNFIKIIPYFSNRANDKWVFYETSASSDGKISIIALESQDMEMITKRVELDTSAEREMPITGISKIYSDQHGGFWTIGYIGTEPYYVTAAIIKKSKLLLSHFDPNGNFTGECVLSLSPFRAITLSDITVAPNGDIYHLQFDEEGVNVVAYRSTAYNSISSEKTTSLQTLPSKNIDGRLHMPLRMLASEYGYTVNWNKYTKTVKLSNQEKKISIANRTAVIQTEGIEKRSVINTVVLNGNNWVSVKDAESILSMPVKTDKTNRVAYLIR